MSAINPASFLTPSPTLQLGASIGAGTVAPDRDRFGDTRNRKDIGGFPSVALAPIQQGVYDHGWNSAPDVSLSSMISTTYPQYYNAQNLDTQQMNHGLSDFNRGVPQATRSRSPFSYQRNTSFRGPPSTYPNTEFKNGIDWQKAFYGLSLGS